MHVHKYFRDREPFGVSVHETDIAGKQCVKIALDDGSDRLSLTLNREQTTRLVEALGKAGFYDLPWKPVSPSTHVSEWAKQAKQIIAGQFAS